MTFTEILQEYNIAYQIDGPNTRPGWVQLDCPWCGGYLYLGFNTYGNYLNCWRCGPENLLKGISELTNQTWGKCKELAGSLASSVNLPEKVQGSLSIPSGVGSLLPCHERYLKKRGYDPSELTRLWGVQGIGLALRLKWRLFLPVTYRGKIVSWTTRGLTNTEPRYISARPDQERTKLKTLLYGEDYARHSIIIVEGPFDVMWIGPGAVGTFGTGFSRSQLLKMSKYPLRVVCFDNELKAQKRAQKLCDYLEPFPGRTIRVELDAADPGSASSKEVKRLRKLFLR